MKLKLKDLEVGKTYRPIDGNKTLTHFALHERRTVKYRSDGGSDGIVVIRDETGAEFSQRINGWSTVEYEEVVPYFEAGKTYIYKNDKNTTYKVTKVNLNGTIDCVETGVLTDIRLTFPMYNEVVEI